jgi:hypothetical protein
MEYRLFSSANIPFKWHKSSQDMNKLISFYINLKKNKDALCHSLVQMNSVRERSFRV